MYFTCNLMFSYLMNPFLKSNFINFIPIINFTLKQRNDTFLQAKLKQDSFNKKNQSFLTKKNIVSQLAFVSYKEQLSRPSQKKYNLKRKTTYYLFNLQVQDLSSVAHLHHRHWHCHKVWQPKLHRQLVHQLQHK